MELEAAFWILLPVVVYLSICCCGGGFSWKVKGHAAPLLPAFRVTRRELVDGRNPGMLTTFWTQGAFDTRFCPGLVVTRCELVDRRGGRLSSEVKGQRSLPLYCVRLWRAVSLQIAITQTCLRLLKPRSVLRTFFALSPPKDPSEPPVIHPTYPPELRYPTYNLTDMTKRHSLCLSLSSCLPGSNVPTSIDLSIYLFIYLFIWPLKNSR